MKLYISAATLQTIKKFGNASLTHIASSRTDHMSVELEVTHPGAAIAAGGAQEAVAWMYSSTRGVDLGRMRWSDDMKALGPADMVETPLYAAPLPRVAATVRLTDEQHKAIAVASTLCESMGYPANAKALDDILAASNGDQA
jgi:hypothetical protein